MNRLISVGLVLLLWVSYAKAQSISLYTGGPSLGGGAQRPFDVSLPPGTTVLQVGGLTLNAKDPIAQAWFQIGSRDGSSVSLGEYLNAPEGQTLSLGSQYLFGGTIPKEWMDFFNQEIGTPGSGGGNTGGGGAGMSNSNNPILSVAVYPPSEGLGDTIFVEINDPLNGESLYFNQATLEENGWWYLSATPQFTMIEPSEPVDPDMSIPELTANPPPAVPEPATIVLGMLACGSAVLARRRTKNEPKA